MNQPFDDPDVIYRFVPTEEEKKKAGSLYAEEFVIVVNHSSYFSFWERSKGMWFHASAHAFIPRLLHEQEKLTEERDIYREAIVRSGDTTGFAREALEQGAKVRDEK